MLKLILLLSFGLQASQYHEELLNAVKNILTTEGEERKEVCEDAQKLLVSGESPTAKKFNHFYKTYCEETLSFVNPNDNRYRPVQDGAYCTKSSNVLHCKNSIKNGKGLFIMRQPNKPKEPLFEEDFPNYLVCASHSTVKSSVVTARVKVLSHCMLSTLPFESYKDDKENATMRSDLKGMYAWILRPSKGKGLQFPEILSKQCQYVFNDSFYCTPTLIVLPTVEDDFVDVCSLTTLNRIVNVPFIKIRRHNSRWNCHRWDLSLRVEDPILTRKQRHCVPRVNGKVRKDCLFPYIPWREEIHLVRSLRCGNGRTGAPHNYRRGSVCEYRFSDITGEDSSDD